MSPGVRATLHFVRVILALPLRLAGWMCVGFGEIGALGARLFGAMADVVEGVE